MPAFKKRLNKSKAECLWVCVNVYVSCFNYYTIYFSAVIINLYRFVFIFTFCSKQIEFEYDEICYITKVGITMIWSNIANILVFLVCCLYAKFFPCCSLFVLYLNIWIDFWTLLLPYLDLFASSAFPCTAFWIKDVDFWESCLWVLFLRDHCN